VKKFGPEQERESTARERAEFLVQCVCGYKVGPVRGTRATARLLAEHGCPPEQTVAVRLLPDAAGRFAAANVFDQVAAHFRGR